MSDLEYTRMRRWHLLNGIDENIAHLRAGVHLLGDNLGLVSDDDRRFAVMGVRAALAKIQALNAQLRQFELEKDHEARRQRDAPRALLAREGKRS